MKNSTAICSGWSQPGMMVRTVSLEDAVPGHIPDTARLAPQELYKPSKGPLLARTEMTKTDRNRHRRQMKVSKKARRKQQDEQLRTLARLDSRKQGAVDKREAVKTLQRNKNVTILPSTSKKFNRRGPK